MSRISADFKFAANGNTDPLSAPPLSDMFKRE